MNPTPRRLSFANQAERGRLEFDEACGRVEREEVARDAFRSRRGLRLYDELRSMRADALRVLALDTLRPEERADRVKVLATLDAALADPVVARALLMRDSRGLLRLQAYGQGPSRREVAYARHQEAI